MGCTDGVVLGSDVGANVSTGKGTEKGEDDGKSAKLGVGALEDSREGRAEFSIVGTGVAV